jgi:predicted PurR-regulated permease PerM
VVGRKLTMLATVLVMPGSLVILAALALVIVLMRTSRGRRMLYAVKRRVPPRVRAQVKRALALVTGEKRFLPEAPHVHSA